jgi:ABC-type lipoprotein release transport system permease subunit
VRGARGLGPGLLALYGTGHLVSGLLYETPPADAVVYVAVAGTTLAAGLVAGLVPVRRAVGLDPVHALRVG